MKQCFYKKNALFVFSQIIVLVLISGNIFSQETDIFLAEAAKLRDNGKTEECLKILKHAEKKNRNNPEILYEIALTYLKIDDIKERIYASDYLELAIKADPENENYMLTYAKLKKRQGFYDTAEKIFLKLSEMDSKNTEVLFEVAEIYLEKAIWHDKMKKVYSDNEGNVPGIVNLNEFADTDFGKANSLFNRILKLEPDNAEALYSLGKLYFFRKNWKKMQKLFSEAVKSRPDYKDAHLFLGYTYYKQKDYMNAFKSFEEAKKYMDNEELTVMDSFDRVFLDKAEIDPSGWTRKNPSFLTGINLRKLEHYARVAYANLHFSKPKMNLPGWKTERGRVLIRFGEPLISGKTAPEICFSERGISKDEKTVLSISGRTLKYITSKLSKNKFKFATEFWAYENIVLSFEDRYLSRNFILNSGSKLAYDQIIKKNPEIYDHPFEKIKFHFPYYCALFKGEDNLQLDVYYSIPKDSIKTRINGVENFKIIQGCYIMSENWDKIEKAVSERELRNNSAEEMVSAICMNIKPGKYNLALEFWEKNNKFFGQEKFPVDIKAFENNLCISDIIMGVPSGTESDKAEGKAFKNDILPRPNLEFSEKEIRIFFEVYNLALKGSSSNFKVVTSISTQKKKKKGFAKLAQSLVNIFRAKTETEISNSYTYRGESENDNIILNIDIASLQPGKYDLDIELTDLIGKTNTKTKRSFLVK